MILPLAVDHYTICSAGTRNAISAPLVFLYSVGRLENKLIAQIFENPSQWNDTVGFDDTCRTITSNPCCDTFFPPSLKSLTVGLEL